MYRLLRSKNPTLYWNMIDLAKDDQKITDIIVLRGFLKKRHALFFSLRSAGKKIIGCSSCSTFPQFDTFCTRNDYIDVLQVYDDKIIAWCHGFRNPLQYIPDSIPRIFISESDMHPGLALLQNRSPIEKKYDLLASIPGGEWNDFVRNLPVAQRWLNYAADEMGLKILIIGKNRQNDFSNNIFVMEDFLDQRDFWDHLASSRGLFVSSENDASPRIIVESLSLNVPVLLNQNIIGGWKYINHETGKLFDPDEDVRSCIMAFLTRTKDYRPLEYAKAHLNYSFHCQHFSLEIDKILGRRFSHYFDGVLYINLKSRADRLRLIQKQLETMEIVDAIMVEGVEDAHNGHLGCAKSHIKALQMAKEKNWKYFIILEDDFTFSLQKERVLYMMETFLSTIEHWDIFMLGYEHEILDRDVAIPMHFIHKFSRATTTIGYAVHHQFRDTLCENFLEAVRLMQNINSPQKITTTEHAIDQHWFSLQKTHGFYGTSPKIGRPNRTRSSIMN